eukprot:COSAG02_NODE_5806_length_4023_cov_5.908002_4_plen_57_part_00
MSIHRIDHFGALSFCAHAKMTAFGVGTQQAWRFFETKLAMSALRSHSTASQSVIAT